MFGCKKADKSKSKFLKRINVRIYELTEGRGISNKILKNGSSSNWIKIF